MQINYLSGFARKTAVLGTIFIVFSAFAGNRMKCDKFTDGPMNNNCGEAPPAGLCSGNCDQITYSATAGECRWTGSWWDNCKLKAPFVITETHTYYEQCLFNAEPTTGYFWCLCSDTPKSTTTRTIIVNCE